MIRIEDLHKSFDGKQVLKGVSLEAQKGELLVLVGMSGYGKSVILKHIVGLLKPDKGRIIVDNLEVSKLKGKALAELRSRIGFLFQGGALFESMTLFDNVAFPLIEEKDMARDDVEQQVLDVLDQVGLKGAEEKYPSQLSGGMQKRAALARELVCRPEIMLFDEPTTGLDPIIGHAILNLIEDLHKNMGFTGIIVSHETQRVFKIANKVLMLHEGVIRAAGTPDEILNSQDPVVKQFIKGETDGPISYR